MRSQPWTHLIIAFVILAPLSGCDQIADNLIDCLDSDGPRFASRDLPMPVLNQEYFAEVVASVENEPNDDSFFYTFEIDGMLPEGIMARQRSNGERRLIFEGTAIEQGTFDFDVTVFIDDPGELSTGLFEPTTSGLCNNALRRDFQLTVAPI